MLDVHNNNIHTHIETLDSHTLSHAYHSGTRSSERLSGMEEECFKRAIGTLGEEKHGLL